jgi:hypothetical protein
MWLLHAWSETRTGPSDATKMTIEWSQFVEIRVLSYQNIKRYKLKVTNKKIT